MNPILETKDLCKTYGTKGKNTFDALKGISLSMEKGEFVGIMGPSGSGKTTLLNILSTLDRPTNGSVLIDGEEVSTLNENQLSDFRSQKLGFIFQDFNLLENMTVFENIALPLSLHGVAPKEIEMRVNVLAEKLGITRILSNYPTDISGGQKQRTAIARALIHEPKVVLGDEPTGALDSKNAKELLQTLARLNQEDHVSVLMVTHDPKSASYCHRVLFIEDGRLLKEIKKESTQEQFYQSILSEMAGLEGTNLHDH